MELVLSEVLEEVELVLIEVLELVLLVLVVKENDVEVLDVLVD